MVRDCVEIRSGKAGAGLFVGCGAGVGYLSPVNLYSIPVVGQLVGSILQNVSKADQGLGGIGHRVTSILGSLQLPGGVRAGVGCGVALGYGWGIGIMLKPSVALHFVDRAKSVLPTSLHGHGDHTQDHSVEMVENRNCVSKEDFETLQHRVTDLEKEMDRLKHGTSVTNKGS